MIGPVHIQNYKSIRELKFDAKRVNVYIGEPNTGKSNIVEALAFFSPGVLKASSEIFRFGTTSDLFYDQNISNKLNVKAGDWEFGLTFDKKSFQGHFLQSVSPASQVPKGNLEMDYKQLSSWSEPKTPLRYYKFKPFDPFPGREPGALNPPFGDNLAALLYTNESLRKKIGALFKEKGFRLQLKPTENELLIAKDVGDELYSYPWVAVSETLQRVAFYMAALETNQNAALLLDEPETNTFPFYTTYLAERIALDTSNQFFLTTHNPYVLGSIVGKTPVKDLAVFIVSMENYATKLKAVSPEGLSKILDYGPDAFLNLDKLAEA
ncbi:MAG TPA: AAA family ATPase [Candidatus Sulfotelmatobacter sp.]|nr:AAA family ATPase [Candidatus Sulfotelmatobacter sp.]